MSTRASQTGVDSTSCSSSARSRVSMWIPAWPTSNIEHRTSNVGQGGAQGDGAVVGDTDGRGWGLPLALRVAFAVGAARSDPGEVLWVCFVFRPRHGSPSKPKWSLLFALYVPRGLGGTRKIKQQEHSLARV